MVITSCLIIQQNSDPFAYLFLSEKETSLLGLLLCAWLTVLHISSFKVLVYTFDHHHHIHVHVN